MNHHNCDRLFASLARILCCGCATIILLAAAPTIAQDSSASDKDFPGNRYVKARLILDKTAITPGTTSHLAAVFDITKNWHLYWRNAGDSGLPPRVKFTAPAGLTIGDPQWPVPTRHVEADMMVDYIFENQLVLIFPVTASQQLSGEAKITADIDWLVCSERCVPGRATVTASFPVAAAAKQSTDADLFTLTYKRHPQPPSKDNSLYIVHWNRHELRIEAKGATHIAFFPYGNEADAYPDDIVHKGAAKSDSLQLTYPDDVKKLKAVAGVLAITRQGVETFHEINLPPPTEGS